MLIGGLAGILRFGEICNFNTNVRPGMSTTTGRFGDSHNVGARNGKEDANSWY